MDIQHDDWLILTDFAAKYRVSVSTLRRRIKSNQIEHRFSDGKYVVRDVRVQQDQSQVKAGHPEISKPLTDSSLRPEPLQQTEQAFLAAGDTHISVAHRLFGELKHAYSSILHEKEEQIVLLKEEIADLKTLVRVLEDDNDRVKRLLDGVSARWS